MNQLIQVRLEFIGNEKVGQYGPTIPVLFKAGEERIWKNYKPDNPELTELRAIPKGTALRLAPAGKTKSGNQKYTVILPEAQTDSLQPPSGKTPPERKRQIADAIPEMTDIWVYCYQQATTKLQADGQSVEPETIRCCASAIFIHVTRRFAQ